MTFDEFVRYLLMPAMGTAALIGIVLTLREFYRDWKAGEL